MPESDLNAQALNQSLELVKVLLKEKKESSKAVSMSGDMFTDPRFIKLFDQYFKPLIDSSKKVASKMTQQRVNILDVLGIDERTQDIKQKQVVRELDKIIDKLKSLSKNINVTSYDGIASVLGLTKTERTDNRRRVNSAIHTLALKINKSASILGDPNMLMKFIGFKTIKMPSVAVPNISISKHRDKTFTKTSTMAENSLTENLPSTTTGGNPSPVLIQDLKEKTLAEKDKASKIPQSVRIVDIAKNLFRHPEKTGDTKTKDSGSDREQYSLGSNQLGRYLGLTTLAAALVPMALKVLMKGLTDAGPLKGLEKMIGTYPLQFMKFIATRTFSILKKVFPMGGEMISTAVKGLKGIALKFTGKEVYKWIAKGLKKLPGIGTLISFGFAFNRIMNGDVFGGLIDVASGLAVDIPVIGIPLAIALDTFNAVEDYKSGGIKVGSGKPITMKQKINQWLQKILPKIPGLSSIFDISKAFGAFAAGNMKEGFGFLARSFPDVLGFGLGDALFGKSDVEEPDQMRGPQAAANVFHAKQFQDKAKKLQASILNGRKYEDLSTQEKAQYDQQSALIKNTDNYIAAQKSTLSNTSAAKNATSNNTQTAVTSKEYDNTQTEESEQENVNTIQPQTSNEPSNILPSNSNQDETVGILKQMNGNLEDMKNKSSEDNDQIQSPLSLINTISAPQNSSGSSPLSFAIQTTRDTCYNNRERIRNMILDNRAFA
jgi:hypothetical protein